MPLNNCLRPWQRVVCLKAPTNMFKSNLENKATEKELVAFETKAKNEAWNNAGKSNAQIKVPLALSVVVCSPVDHCLGSWQSSWVCTGNDRTIANSWAAAF